MYHRVSYLSLKKYRYFCKYEFFRIYVWRKKIKGLDNLSVAELNKELSEGGKFVVFPYAVSLLVVTLRETSDIYFVKGDESMVKYGFKYMFVSLLLGRWRILWVAIYTIRSIVREFTGRDVTKEVVQEINNLGENPFHL